MKAPRCGARTRNGTPCRAPAMKNGRCRLHGGKSTGPRTKEGIEKIREAHFIHGRYTKDAVQERKGFNAVISHYREVLKEIHDLV